MYYEGTFNKYSMMEMGVHGIRDKSLPKFRGEGVARLICHLLIFLRCARRGGESNIAYTLQGNRGLIRESGRLKRQLLALHTYLLKGP